jgi:histidinol-phosphate/aromatic aminotransferase/cobyric acid decarboxylase-like protein/GNAT superfamily N-acetyltransferase
MKREFAMEDRCRNTARNSVTLRLASEEDRTAIYRMRHEVYAEELHQHTANDGHTLVDALDEWNVYLVACVGPELAGFISITPPSAPAFSVEKHIPRDDLPVQRDAQLFEARLLTVRPRHRGTSVATFLMYGALRYVEANGGTRIIGIGRHEVMPVYRKVGFETLGREVQSGAVTFHLMSATTDQLRTHLNPSWLARVEREVDWRLPFALRQPAPCFHGGAFFEAVGEEFDTLWKRREIISADVLDAWFPPSPRVVGALQEHLSWLTRTSPPAGCEGMLRVIAGTRRVDERCVLPGGGSSDLIFLALRQWLTKSSRVLLLDPTYGEYAHVLEKVIGCAVTRFRLKREDHYAVNIEALGTALKSNFDLAVLVNPNSPTGRHAPAAALREVLRGVPPSTRVWIDETYVEYTGAEQSLEQFACATRNVVVCKSMSKVYALSGLRAAYLCGPRHLIEELRAITPPWAVSLPAQVAAVNALQDPCYYRQKYFETHRYREELTRGLGHMGFEVTPGVANFLLCHLPATEVPAAELVRRCRAQNLFLRDVSNMGVTERAIRIAVKDQATNETMLRILRGAIETARDDADVQRLEPALA